MIAVLADDLSGAAELAGAALRHGLRAEVQTGFDPTSDADVVCVDLGTRSGPVRAAAAAAAEAARLLAGARPAWIYKKCDSVLRGHVLAELRAIMEATGLPRAILIPANPSRQRVIRGGHLFVEGRPLHTTGFARDPEHPRTSSNVAELLGGDLAGVCSPDVDCAATRSPRSRPSARSRCSILPWRDATDSDVPFTSTASAASAPAARACRIRSDTSER